MCTVGSTDLIARGMLAFRQDLVLALVFIKRSQTTRCVFRQDDQVARILVFLNRDRTHTEMTVQARTRIIDTLARPRADTTLKRWDTRAIEVLTADGMGIVVMKEEAKGAARSDTVKRRRRKMS